MALDSTAANLRQVPLFANLPAVALHQLDRIAVSRAYPDGHVLCNEGDLGESLYVLESGEVRVSRNTPDGQEVVLAIVEAPAAIGELSLIDGARRAATVSAQGPVSVRLIPRAAFLALMEVHPEMVRAILLRLTEMLRKTNQLHVDVLSLDVPGRLAKWLLERSSRHGAPLQTGVAFKLGRTQSDLAAELGTTRSTLNRALNRFEELGLITVEGEQVTLNDRQGLATYAE